ncbi:MAG TPA: hypothetical protein VL651_11630 [Bacteroidia bacterium]|jgi:hypothetical protein|nr:hypothetical protein [Bacteroidia bacterium]
MSFIHYLIPSTKKKFITELPPQEVENRLNWFISNTGRGGPLHGLGLIGGFQGNTFFFKTALTSLWKGTIKYALVCNGNELVLHARWKSGYRNAILILAGCVLIGFTIEMFDEPMKRTENLQALPAFPVLYAVLVLITKMQVNNVSVFIKNMLNGRDA